jgi:putative peptide zinc metalloprotease protein
LEVLAGEEHDALGGSEVMQAVEVLDRHFNLVCLDTGAGVPGSATERALALADQVVIVGEAGLDSARAASSTLDWLDVHDHHLLAASAVAVLNAIRPTRRRRADIDRIEAHFASRCRACVRIPWDPHLETGADAELNWLRPATREAFVELAAVIADGFSEPTEGRS